MLHQNSYCVTYSQLLKGVHTLICCCIEMTTHPYQPCIISGDITIEDDLMLTVNTDSQRENVTYTFTCISSGGPATTVTWTRDYVVIPEGERTTVLDSLRSARYIHNLTLTGRLDGIYHCIVSNNKPSQDSAQLLIQCMAS